MWGRGGSEREKDYKIEKERRTLCSSAKEGNEERCRRERRATERFIDILNVKGEGKISC